MEIKITEFIKNESMCDYSASVAELGNDAGQITWNHALEDSKEYMFVNPGNQAEIIEYFDSFGAWELEELEAWDIWQLNALLIQFIAGDYREYGIDNEDSRIFTGTDNEIYIYIGN